MSRSTDGWVLVGSGPGVLALAERLSAHGRRVTVLNPQRQWGGVFAGTVLEGQTFDNGMTNFEFELFGDPQADLASYHPESKDSIGKYVHFVRAYLQRFVTTHEVPCPQMLWDGQLHPDLLISNRFEVIRALSPALKASMAGELRNIAGAPAPHRLHARHKAEDPATFVRHSFEEVSLANHGPTFHRLFVAPLFEKVLGVPTAQVPALFHRSGWSPLFYPETLLSQLGPEPQVLKRTVFHYPDDSHFGAFLGRLVEAVRARPSARIVEGATELSIDAGRRVVTTAHGHFEYDRLVWGADLAPLAAIGAPAVGSAPAPEPPARASLRLTFLRVRREGLRDHFSVLLDPDPAAPFYRVTNQSLSSARDPAIHQLILECNSDRWQSAPGTDEEKLDAALARYGIERAAVVSRDHRTFDKALAIPSAAQLQRFNARRAELARALPDVAWIGPGSGYSSVTLNDQMIQALQIAHAHEVLD